jgi:hypothetical protein
VTPVVRVLAGFSIIAAMVAAGLFVAAALSPEPDRPPHVERPTAGAPAPLAAVGGEVIDPAPFDAAYGQQINEAIYAQAAVEETARVEATRSTPKRGVAPQGGSFAGDCARLSAELGLPESVLWRESRCSWDAYNATGCGGRSCRGPAQLDAGHFAPVSPWNGNVPGTCAGLDPNNAADYAECVSRLPRTAW